MPHVTSQAIAQQNTAYRRGLVLGLTMAEVGILIIFILLLLLALGELAREQALAAQRDKVSITNDRLQSLEASEQVLVELSDVVGAGPNATPKEIQRLVRVVQEAAATARAKSSLANARVEIDKLREASRRLEIVAEKAENQGVEALHRELVLQSYELADKDGQLKLRENQLQAAGLGKGERPCWVKPDGTIEYLYDVVLASSGIRLREYIYPERTEMRALLPMPNLINGEALSVGDFLSRTQPLYAQSLAQNCRFFVVVYDATEPTEKELYKRLLRAVEGHFYKRLDSGPAPF